MGSPIFQALTTAPYCFKAGTPFIQNINALIHWLDDIYNNNKLHRQSETANLCRNKCFFSWPETHIWLKASWTSVHYILSNLTARQTDKQTNQHDQKYYLPSGGKNILTLTARESTLDVRI